MSKQKPAGEQKRSVPKKVDWKALEIVHLDAAGIDVGGSEHWVAISPERDEQSVRCFDCFPTNLEQMADWSVERGVRSVAMRSRVSWIPVLEILQERGLEVTWSTRGTPRTCLGARATSRNASALVPGPKTGNPAGLAPEGRFDDDAAKLHVLIQFGIYDGHRFRVGGASARA